MRAVTYTLRFYRNRRLLEAQIHRTLEDIGQSAYGLALCFGHSVACTQLEQLLLYWDPDLGDLCWGDGEYEIVLQQYIAKHAPNENNDCRVIPIRRDREAA